MTEDEMLIKELNADINRAKVALFRLDQNPNLKTSKRLIGRKTELTLHLQMLEGKLESQHNLNKDEKLLMGDK